jgi:Leucine-rich repeat (LRR) protein
MELKKWVTLNLSYNNLHDWVKAIAKNMKLEKLAYLDLTRNYIDNSWAEVIINNMELKEWVVLDLSDNLFWDEMREKLKEWEKSYHDKWINCKVII